MPHEYADHALGRTTVTGAGFALLGTVAGVGVAVCAVIAALQRDGSARSTA
ncbi:hypothetical protein [Streptomyces nojiriensis]|uniref:hypothetical protein n=1 Tax=Streptomyces nojiriensis TaxID=66374 RepID=UPI0035E11796